MTPVASSRLTPPPSRWNSFTLVELLLVIALIAILTSLLLYGAAGLMQKASRARATAEIKAMDGALLAYKEDSGAYPVGTAIGLVQAPPTQNYPLDPTAQAYKTDAQSVYQALSGRTNYLDDVSTSGAKIYMTFKATQLGNAKAAAGSSGTSSTYVQDPWGYAYGYSTYVSTDKSQYPYNGLNNYDLWTTGNTLNATTAGNTTPTNSWIGNWSDTGG